MPSQPRSTHRVRALSLPWGRLALLSAVCLTAGGAHAASVTNIELLGSVQLPTSVPGISGSIGGLSDIAFDPVTGEWVLLSDEARAFSMTVDLSDGSLDDGDAAILAELPLNLSPTNDDPEGLDIGADGSWWVGTEGNANRNDAEGGGFEPVVGRVDPASGNLMDELPLPDPFDPIAPNGIRHNMGFEGVAISPDGSQVFTGAEYGLSQDEIASGGELTRLIRYDLASGQAVAEYPYLLDDVGLSLVSGVPPNGLVAMLSTGEDELLALERAVTFTGFSLRLYGVDLSGASDVSGMPEIATAYETGSLVTADKTLLLDLTSSSNVEGLAFGPWDGLTRPLLTIADNGDGFSTNQLAAFRVTFDQVFPAPGPTTPSLLLLGLALVARRCRVA